MSKVTVKHADTGISNDKLVKIDSASVVDNDYAKFTANGLEGMSYNEVADDIEGELSITASQVSDFDTEVSNNTTVVSNQTFTEDQKNFDMSPSEFIEIDSFSPTISGAVQGMTNDGTYLYLTTSTHLYKYNSSGVLQDSEDMSSHAHSGFCGGCVYHDGVIYVTAHNADASTIWIQEYSSSTLAYDTETELSVGYISSIDYYDGAFWGITDLVDSYVYKFASNWSVDTTYDIYNADIEGDWKFQEITFDGNYALCNIHEGSMPQATRIFYFDGTDFILKENSSRPDKWGQGITKMGDYYYFCTRESTPRVVKSLRIPATQHTPRIITASPSSNYTTTGTSAEKVTLATTVAQCGYGFSISGGSIIVGPKISQVKVSANGWWRTGMSAGDRVHIKIYKNSTEVFGSMVTVNTTDQGFFNCSIAPCLLDVAEDDEINLYVRSEDGSGAVFGSDSKYVNITVEAVK